MRETLVIRLGQREGAEWQAGPLQTPPSRGALDEALDEAAGRRIIVLVPSEHVLLTHVDLPIKNRQKLLQAAPFALEDQLAEDIESLHFALGPHDATGRVTVAVVTHAQMDEWLAPFREHGLDPDVLMPDVLAVPLQPSGADDPPSWSLLPDGDTVLVRCGPYSGFSADRDVLPDLIRLAAGDTLPRLHRYPAEEESLPLPSLPAQAETSARPATPFMHLLSGGATSPAINLLQGVYAPGHGALRWWQIWRPTAAFAVACLVLFTAVRALTYRQLGARIDHLQSRATQTFHHAFPGIHRIVDMRAQGEQAMSALAHSGTSGTFTPLLRAAAQALDKVPTLHVTQLRYGDNGLSLSLRGPNLQSLDTLRQALAQVSNVALDVRSANADSGGVQLEIRLQLRSEGEGT